MKKTFYLLWCFLVLCSQNLLKAETAPAADFLMPDGTLNAYAIGNQQLTLDLAGWHVELDPKRGLVFSPAPPPLSNTWSALGGGVYDATYTSYNPGVYAVAVSGSDIYVGGDFTAVGTGGTAVTGLNQIAKWNGTAWSALDKGLNNDVRAIAVSGSNIYVGGYFTEVGTDGAAVTGLNNIAKWNGTAWSALDKGLNSTVTTIAVSGSNIYVGGNFTEVGTDGAAVTGLNNIAKWNGTAWSALDKGLGLNSAVRAIAVSGSNIYVGGYFDAVGTGGTAVTGLNNIAKWNGTAWSALDKGLNGVVSTIAVSGSNIYVGGNFDAVGTGGTAVTGLNNIAKWNGTAWSALDKGLSGGVLAITVSGSDIYVGGNFDAVGTDGTAVTGLNNIAKWDASAVLPVELLDFNGRYTEGGNFLTWQTANEVNNKGFEVQRLNGNDWQTLGFVNSNNKASAYTFTDNNPLATSYYRLRQMDFEGTETVSKVISIAAVETRHALSLHPNPVSNVLTVEYTEGASFQVINLLGQQVLTGKTTTQIDVSTLAKGTYMLKVGSEVAKFVKQ